MKKLILIDGNNLVFRSYYATAYNGNLMKNSKGFPTNAIFGFVNMLNKIISDEKADHILVAFDKGKNFRHELYNNYKDGRIETPDDLKKQFPYVKEILKLMNIMYYECDNYEADDIIGTLSTNMQEDVEVLVVSSDKDLLQLIGKNVKVKHLKKNDYILYDYNTFVSEYKFEPKGIIDLKALMGDASDNIPGVKGVGEKTALTLIQKYENIDNLYEHIDEVKGKLKEKLINDKENAYFSRKLATIYTTIDIDLDYDKLQVGVKDDEGLKKIYEDLEFYKFLKEYDIKKENVVSYEKYDSSKYDFLKSCAFYLELDSDNYQDENTKILLASLYDGNHLYYLDEETLLDNLNIFNKVNVTYDLKKVLVFLNKYNITINEDTFDNMISSYLLDYNVKDDIAYIANIKGYHIEFYENIISKRHGITFDELVNAVTNKSVFLFNTKDDFINELKANNVYDLYEKIEKPLIRVLASMEIEGIKVDKNEIEELKNQYTSQETLLKKQIYEIAGEEFNISSSLQLSKILFEKLNIPYRGKKKNNNYSTDQSVLLKLISYNPIIELIIEYRKIRKLLTSYMDSLTAHIQKDGCIHTIYKQALTRTGRLSSVYPNLQNIPIKSEEGKQIRKAFISKYGQILSSDYSQIELRVLAHISGDETMINAFNNDIDIHSEVASDIFGVELKDVTKEMRKKAKAVIFGIVYGISGFGLGENLSLSPLEAKKFIDKYLELYPKVKEYMDNIVKSSRESGFVLTLMNRKRVIDEINNTNYIIRQSGERIALNTPIQGSSADIIKLAMVNIYKRLQSEQIKSKMILQIHDELVFDIYKAEKEKIIKIVTEEMENTYKLSVPLKVHVECGDNWFEA